jgi:hypothetical protein
MNGPFLSERGIFLPTPQPGAISPTVRAAFSGNPVQALKHGAKAGRRDKQNESPARSEFSPQLRPNLPYKFETILAAQA